MVHSRIAACLHNTWHNITVPASVSSLMELLTPYMLSLYAIINSNHGGEALSQLFKRRNPNPTLQTRGRLSSTQRSLHCYLVRTA